MSTLSTLSTLLKLIFKPKLVHLKQRQPGEHGIVCASILLSYFGIKKTPDDIAKLFPDYKHGVSLRGMSEIFSAFDLPIAVLQCPYDKISAIKPPFVFLWKMQQFAILESIENDGFKVSDPCFPKKMIFPAKEFETCFSEVVLVPKAQQ